MRIISNKSGQALVEYVCLLAFLIILSTKLVNGFTDFMRGSVGNLGHVMSLNLSTGVCPKNCFFRAYKNSPPFPAEITE